MSPIRFLSKSRGTRNLVSRIGTVLRRFGISSKKFECLLNRYTDVTHQLGYMPTFAITAVVLKRHPELIRKLSQRGVEFAIHGYVHIDYMTLSLDEQYKHFEKAIDTFKVCEIPFVGFRAPFLRVNEYTSGVLNNLGFLYDSSPVIHWNAVDLNKCSRYARSNHDQLLEFYQPQDAGSYLSLPRFKNNVIEIPVLLPDDESIVDRLGITDKRKISEIWQDILRGTYDSGELFTLQLHPERISHCENALIDVLQQAKGLNPPVWVATLGEITEWWRERDRFSFELHSQGDGRYQVKADCSDRATVLLKNSKVNVPVDAWLAGYQSITARDFVLESPTRPVIGVGRDSSPDAVSFLQSEGYIVEMSEQPDNYGVYLNNLAEFDEAAKKPLSEEIEQSDAPLIRYWRWPDRARSALSITGDIDSITLSDFALRIWENWRQRLK